MRSIPNNKVFRASEGARNIKLVNSRYAPSHLGSSYGPYEDRHRTYGTSGYGSTSHTYTK